MLALVTATSAKPHDSDLAPLVDTFARIDVPVTVACWDDPDVEWQQFDAVFVRSTWDYADRLDDFLTWLDATTRATRVVNSADAIRWNIDKHYLSELAAAGVPTVPTTFVEPGEVMPTLDAAQSVWVVKPAVGAGSNGAKRCTYDEVADHVALLHASGRSAMVQPYLHMIDEQAETPMVFIGDGGALEFDHAFRKAAILSSADVARVGDLMAHEEIRERSATADERALGVAVLASDVVGALGPLAYARVDVAPTEQGPVLMELELIEPSFYFDTSEGSADRAAQAWKTFLRR